MRRASFLGFLWLGRLFDLLTQAGFPGFLSSEHGCLREAGFLGFLAYDWFLAVQGGLGLAKGWFVVFFQWTSFRLLTQAGFPDAFSSECGSLRKASFPGYLANDWFPAV